MPKANKMIKIKNVNMEVEREPYLRPFGFKGQFDYSTWFTFVCLESVSGIKKVGLHNQSVLWADAKIYDAFSNFGGNCLMFSVTEKALQLLKNCSFYTPIDLLENIFPEVYAYGKRISENRNLRKTFILNALVGIDLAAWLLFAEEHGLSAFEELIPGNYKTAFSFKHNRIACVPLISYAVPVEELEQMAESGFFVFKIKIGNPGKQEEMLEKDKARISAIHQRIGNLTTPYTRDGKIPYYFDANGRYEKRETLNKLLDHTRKIGVFDRILILEEPFPEEEEYYVNDFGIRIAADESIQTEEDARIRIQMGYSAFALKPIAKTLSQTIKIAQVAKNNNIPCFCADLTVPPVLVEWNKAVAARLEPFPGLDMGILEMNGFQNYRNWDKLMNCHPFPAAPWVEPKNGIFYLDKDYYTKEGGIFQFSRHYLDKF
jgi:L-alanine-DL-glutamate epimerase-like enolase superfamily enzyme